MLRKFGFFMVCSALMASLAFAADVTLRASDGSRIHADYSAVADAKKGVVLVHQLSGQASDWRFTADALNKAGLTTISVDLRGHGGSKDVVAGELGEADYGAMMQDVTAAVEHLRKQGIADVSIVGASIGANLALKVAAADPKITTVVLLSPGMNYKGHDAGEALAKYGERPVLMVVSKDDTYSAKTALVLDKQAKGPHKLEIYDSAGHGTKMFAKAPGLERLVVGWLINPLQAAGVSTAGAGAGTSVTTDVGGTITTTGKKLGEE
ncbi:MAG: alpha/beta fold hydrolase [Alphaproteobacteria bacterium]|nr:alpha/beta fold hydrolase [Alphaproteobacteria bacterium]